MTHLTQLFNKGIATRDNILDLQEAMVALDCSKVDCNEIVEHHWAPMVYGREIFMPEGMVIVGKIHKHAHLNVLLTGKVKVATEFGNEYLEAPHIWTSEPGTKRAVYVVEACRWLTVHPNPTDTHDLTTIEDYVIAPDFRAFDQFQLENTI